MHSTMPDVTVLSVGTRDSQEVKGTTPLVEALGQAGIRASACETMLELIGHLKTCTPSVVLLEAGPSDRLDTAYTLAAILSSTVESFVVMLVNGAQRERARGLNCGADICLSSPVNILELSAVVNALQRRFRRQRSCHPRHFSTLKITSDKNNAWLLKEHGWVLRTPNGTDIPLTNIERAFMQQLFQAPNKLLPRIKWNEVFFSLAPSGQPKKRGGLDAAIWRLRRKVESTYSDFPLYSRRGVGYQFTGMTIDD